MGYWAFAPAIVAIALRAMSPLMWGDGLITRRACEFSCMHLPAATDLASVEREILHYSPK
jgi:hypothetical protein